MSRVESSLERAAQTFVEEVLGILRAIELEDLVELRRGGSRARVRPVAGSSGKRVRRSLDTIQAEAKRVAALVGRSKEGLRAEDIREKSGLERKEIPRVIKEALAMGLLKAKGQKRATTYFAK